jgi:inorganic triphosphatase YgiF
MTVNVNETEIKYDAPAGAALPRLDNLPQVVGTSGPDEERLEAEYYDTGDLRLIRAGITLRRRRGGHDAGWHLKLPLGTATGREIRLPLDRTGRRVPDELARLVRVRTRGEPLRPVARMTTTRQRLTLLDQPCPGARTGPLRVSARRRPDRHLRGP